MTWGVTTHEKRAFFHVVKGEQCSPSRYSGGLDDLKAPIHPRHRPYLLPQAGHPAFGIHQNSTGPAPRPHCFDSPKGLLYAAPKAGWPACARFSTNRKRGPASRPFSICRLSGRAVAVRATNTAVGSCIYLVALGRDYPSSCRLDDNPENCWTLIFRTTRMPWAANVLLVERSTRGLLE